MDHRIRFRILQIASSVACAVVCLLMIALWVRSYSWMNQVRVGNTAIALVDGRLFANDVWNISKTEPELMKDFSQRKLADNVSMWSAPRGALTPVGVGKSIPGWPLIVLAAAMVIAPWLRFSLRTLLIAVTLVAATMGLAVALK